MFFPIHKLVGQPFCLQTLMIDILSFFPEDPYFIVRETLNKEQNLVLSLALTNPNIVSA